MSQLQNNKMATVPKRFAEYSLALAEQLDVLWKRSMHILTRDQITRDDQVTLTKSSMRRSALSFLKAMPYLEEGLDRHLSRQWVEKGLNAILSETDREQFEWVMNREVTEHLSASEAASVDVGFSNILAMHTENPEYKPRTHEQHLKFKAISPVLARQVADLNERSQFQDGKPHTLSPKRLRRSLLSLVEMLPVIMRKLPNRVADRLFKQGFDCLKNSDDCNLIEYFGVHESMENTELETRFDDALTNIRSMYFDRDLFPFSHIKLTHQSIDISRAMTLTYGEFFDIKSLFEYVGTLHEKDGNKTTDSVVDNLNSSLNHVQNLLENDLRDLDLHLPIKDRLIRHQALVKNYIERLPNKPRRLILSLKRIAPEVYGKHRSLPLPRAEDFFNYLQSISRSFAEQYKKYLEESEEPTYAQVYFQKSLGKYLFVHRQDKDVTKVISLLREHGIGGLADNGGLGFSLLRQHIQENTSLEQTPNNAPLNSALGIYNCINGSNDRIGQFSESSILFENENDGTSHSIDFGFLAKHYPQVFKDFSQYIEINKIRTDGGAIQQITVKSHVSHAFAVFRKYHDTLNPEDIESLSKQGLSALGNDSCQLLRHFRQQIQKDAKASKLKAPYAIGMQTSLNQLASFFGVPKSKAHKVTNSKEKRLAKRKSDKDLYTLQQVVQIAYVIEKLLKQNDLTDLQKLCLHAARIFIKTGWNLTPTLELDEDDLVYFNVPFQGNKTAAVRLFKRRANYQTKWSHFAPEEKTSDKSGSYALNEFETGRVTAGVISNLEDIRDMTSGIASKHSSPKLRRRIFAYYDRTEPKILTSQGFTSVITRLLKKEGVEESFSVTRIRKTGMNTIYRSVAKNFEKYRKAGMHTPQAFFEHYLKMNDLEVEETLSKATGVMGDFFIRGLDDDVIFVEKAPKNSKQTPSGRCVQEPDSDVVIDFRKRNRRFLDEDEITACADFGSCLICKFFRCIADAESVWRLLSYEQVVVDRMVSASYSIGGNDGSEQQLRIKKLKRRVNDVLARLSKKNATAIHDGKALFEEHGVHPDWEVV